jgi:hypothetical protein
VQNPRSNRNNNVGYPAALRMTTRAAVGTDGFPADLRVERDALHEIGRAAGERGEDLDARCMGSLRLASELLRLEPATLPAGVTVGEWFAARARAAIEHLDVDGRPVCRDGSLLTGDVEAIHADAVREARRLWTRLPAEA